MNETVMHVAFWIHRVAGVLLPLVVLWVVSREGRLWVASFRRDRRVSMWERVKQVERTGRKEHWLVDVLCWFALTVCVGMMMWLALNVALWAADGFRVR